MRLDPTAPGPSRDERREIERLGRKLSRTIAEDVKHNAIRGRHDLGFVVLLFTIGEGGFMTHVSTTCREVMIALVEEYLDALKRRSSSPPML